MSITEEEIVGVLYLLYLWDCIVWVPAGESAFLGGDAGWGKKEAGPSSFTLLGRMPLMKNPLSTRARPMILGAANIPPAPRLLRRARALHRNLVVLTVYAAIDAVFLLLFVPLLIFTGWLSAFWRPCLLAAVLLHLNVLMEFYRNTSRWRVQAGKFFWESFAAIALNPLAAVRSPDVVMRWELAHPGRSDRTEKTSSTPKR